MLAVVVGVVVAGCGGGASTSTEGGAKGGPGDPAKATRTVEIRAGDDLRFQPDHVDAKMGETITFKVVNVAQVAHDFTLGDDQAQTDHEKEMTEMSGGSSHAMGDSQNAVHMAPGETKMLTWTFTSAGTTLYGCHEPGHYTSGMKGTITVT